jgi:DNA-binding transcriptional MerR regulator
VRIGELGERVGVNPKTIRYYEDLGLISPPDRDPSGYRAYRKEAVARLRFIRAAQSIGLTLGEIREVLSFRDRGEAPCSHVAALIERHAHDLAERIAALESMRADLDRLAKKARTAQPRESGYCHIIETHAIGSLGDRLTAARALRPAPRRHGRPAQDPRLGSPASS